MDPARRIRFNSQACAEKRLFNVMRGLRPEACIHFSPTRTSVRWLCCEMLREKHRCYRPRQFDSHRPLWKRLHDHRSGQGHFPDENLICSNIDDGIAGVRAILVDGNVFNMEKAACIGDDVKHFRQDKTVDHVSSHFDCFDEGCVSVGGWDGGRWSRDRQILGLEGFIVPSWVIEEAT